MSKYIRAQLVTKTEDLIIETLPPSIAKPVTLRLRSYFSGRYFRSYIEAIYRTNTEPARRTGKDDQ